MWTPDKTLSPAERVQFLRIPFGPYTQRRNAKTADEVSHPVDIVGVDKDAPAAAGTAPGLAD